MKNPPKPDGKRRCAWPLTPLALRYHDREWGVPLKNDRKIFEFLVLDAAQAGLSWDIILRKREGFRAAFAAFDPAKVARYDRRKVRRLLADPGIIRNRRKIEAAITNARAFLAVQKEFGSFAGTFGSSLASARGSIAGVRCAISPRALPNPTP